MDLPRNETVKRFFSAPERPRWLDRYRFALRVTEQGSIVSIGDGIAHIAGLPSAAMEDILEFEDGSRAVVFALEPENLSAILLSQGDKLTAGAVAYLSRQRLSIAVGDALIGRVIDPLGVPLDGGAVPECSGRRELERLSPPIIHREVVNEPLYSGNKIVDTLIPIGKGQRQLLIGDNGLGKSSLAIDTVINQKGKNVLCVYVLIGQKRSSVVSTIATLGDAGALGHTTIVVAEATATPGLQYLAPFAGCAVAEAWMAQGKDTLIVYDDLTAHAQAYRELSLLLRRPPGREAFPGDIFYLHSRLLERSTRLAAAQGGGSMTALPIIETRGGEIAAYIPTNLISITDGQIYFDAGLFASGFLPAIDVTKSVSRIGGKAQNRHIAQEVGHMKLDYLQFLELEVFTRFGARLEPSIEAKIQRGRILREALKQDRLAPVSDVFHIAWMVAYNDGYLSRLSADRIAPALRRLEESVRKSGLTLASKRNEWTRLIAAVLETFTEGGKLHENDSQQ
ncbi:MAG TPA: F0F1 ATP synthase subunit alpha [Terriglobales bacterium]|nr:F0F1 ATP synthase subunit alpha [Terriglobales bacterium]